MIYSVGKVIVILYVNYKKQEFYLNHENEILSVATSFTSKNLCASGEMCPSPSIHIWQRDTMKTLAVLKGDHVNGVLLISFIYEDKYIISCSLKIESSIIIHDWENHVIIHSFNLISTVQDIDTFSSEVNNENILLDSLAGKNYRRLENYMLDNCAVICTNYEIVVVKFKNNSFNTFAIPAIKSDNNSEILSVGIIKYFKEEENSELKIQTHSGILFLTGHKDGSVNLWNEKGFISIYISC